MTEKTAVQLLADRTNDEIAAKRTADTLIALLRDFIHDQRIGDAWRSLADSAYKEGWELTSKEMRRRYEAWESLQLKGLDLDVVKPARTELETTKELKS